MFNYVNVGIIKITFANIFMVFMGPLIYTKSCVIMYLYQYLGSISWLLGIKIVCPDFIHPCPKYLWFFSKFMKTGESPIRFVNSMHITRKRSLFSNVEILWNCYCCVVHTPYGTFVWWSYHLYHIDSDSVHRLCFEWVKKVYFR